MEVFHTAFLYPDRIRVSIFDYFLIIFFFGARSVFRVGSLDAQGIMGMSKQLLRVSC